MFDSELEFRFQEYLLREELSRVIEDLADDLYLYDYLLENLKGSSIRKKASNKYIQPKRDTLKHIDPFTGKPWRAGDRFRQLRAIIKDEMRKGTKLKDIFVTYVRGIDKLGVFPGAGDGSTPHAIYGYPAEYILRKIKNDASHMSVPYAGDAPYIIVYKIKDKNSKGSKRPNIKQMPGPERGERNKFRKKGATGSSNQDFGNAKFGINLKKLFKELESLDFSKFLINLQKKILSTAKNLLGIREYYDSVAPMPILGEETGLKNVRDVEKSARKLIYEHLQNNLRQFIERITAHYERTAGSFEEKIKAVTPAIKSEYKKFIDRMREEPYNHTSNFKSRLQEEGGFEKFLKELDYEGDWDVWGNRRMLKNVDVKNNKVVFDSNSISGYIDIPDKYKDEESNDYTMTIDELFELSKEKRLRFWRDYAPDVEEVWENIKKYGDPKGKEENSSKLIIKNKNYRKALVLIAKMLKKALLKLQKDFAEKADKFSFPFYDKLVDFSKKNNLNLIDALNSGKSAGNDGEFIYKVARSLSGQLTRSGKSKANPIAWTKTLRAIGIDGISDRFHTGSIHTAEPSQAFFFHSGMLDVIGIVDTEKNVIDRSPSGRPNIAPIQMWNKWRKSQGLTPDGNNKFRQDKYSDDPGYLEFLNQEFKKAYGIPEKDNIPEELNKKYASWVNKFSGTKATDFSSRGFHYLTGQKKQSHSNAIRTSAGESNISRSLAGIFNAINSSAQIIEKAALHGKRYNPDMEEPEYSYNKYDDQWQDLLSKGCYHLIKATKLFAPINIAYKNKNLQSIGYFQGANNSEVEYKIQAINDLLKGTKEMLTDVLNQENLQNMWRNFWKNISATVVETIKVINQTLSGQQVQSKYVQPQKGQTLGAQELGNKMRVYRPGEEKFGKLKPDLYNKPAHQISLEDIEKFEIDKNMWENIINYQEKNLMLPAKQANEARYKFNWYWDDPFYHGDQIWKLAQNMYKNGNGLIKIFKNPEEIDKALRWHLATGTIPEKDAETIKARYQETKAKIQSFEKDPEFKSIPDQIKNTPAGQLVYENEKDIIKLGPEKWRKIIDYQTVMGMIPEHDAEFYAKKFNKYWKAFDKLGLDYAKDAELLDINKLRVTPNNLKENGIESYEDMKKIINLHLEIGNIMKINADTMKNMWKNLFENGWGKPEIWDKLPKEYTRYTNFNKEIFKTKQDWEEYIRYMFAKENINKSDFIYYLGLSKNLPDKPKKGRFSKSKSYSSFKDFTDALKSGDWQKDGKGKKITGVDPAEEEEDDEDNDTDGFNDDELNLDDLENKFNPDDYDESDLIDHVLGNSSFLNDAQQEFWGSGYNTESMPPYTDIDDWEYDNDEPTTVDDWEDENPEPDLEDFESEEEYDEAHDEWEEERNEVEETWDKWKELRDDMESEIDHWNNYGEDEAFREFLQDVYVPENQEKILQSIAEDEGLDY